MVSLCAVVEFLQQQLGSLPLHSWRLGGDFCALRLEHVWEFGVVDEWLSRGQAGEDDEGEVVGDVVGRVAVKGTRGGFHGWRMLSARDIRHLIPMWLQNSMWTLAVGSSFGVGGYGTVTVTVMGVTRRRGGAVRR
jgi:hypothetical protein